MSQVSWLTPAGSLGTIVELDYYEFAFDAYDAAAGLITYKLISGTLPLGIQVISGSATTAGRLQGIPVSERGGDTNVEYKFTIRAKNNSTGSVADRTFTLIVSNVAPPIITPKNVDLGTYSDGSVISHQLVALEYLPGASIEWTVKRGELPPGLSLSSDGLLSGYLYPIVDTAAGNVPNWDMNPWAYSPWEFDVKAIAKTFSFTIQTYDGTSYDTSDYTLKVIPKSQLTADSTLLTVDLSGNGLTTSTDSLHNPILLTPAGSLPDQRQDTYLAFQFEAVDVDGDVIKYRIPTATEGTFDQLSNAVPSVTYIDSQLVSSNLYIGTNKVDANTGVRSCFVPGTDYIKTRDSNNRWQQGIINNHVTIGLTGNITANIGDTVSQTVSGASATVVANVASANVVQLLYTTSNVFTLGTSTISNLSIKVNSTASNVYVSNIVSIGVTVSGSSYEVANYDTAKFDQGVLAAPVGFTIDEDTGWLTGNLPTLSVAKEVYNFQVIAYKSDPIYGGNYDSEVKFYSLTVFGDPTDRINWLTPTDLGTIENGESSTFIVEASNTLGKKLTYSLADVSIDYNNPGSGASGRAVVDPISGEIIDIVIDKPGSGYLIAPTVSIISATGIGAEASAAITDGKVTNVFINEPGINYQNSPVSIIFKDVGNKLPQGLNLLTTGVISGRVSFELFSMDNGSTTFDSEETTFDRTYVFTVEARDIDNVLTKNQTFKIRVVNRNTAPYENLYLKALPSRTQRAQYADLIGDSTIFPPDLIYRVEDPYYGLQKDLRFLFLPGLNASELSDYMSAVSTNHFTKKINFGEIKTAAALDSSFNTIYEVIYVEVIDPSTTFSGQSPSNTQYPQMSYPYLDSQGNQYTTAYPNAFGNMSDKITTALGYENKGALPLWMTSNQPTETGTFTAPLGFIKAIPIAYTMPGASKLIAYRLQNSTFNFNEIDFTFDRYELDNSRSSNYDIANQEYLISRETTFDRYPSVSSVLTVEQTVDYASSIAFDKINRRSVTEINRLGGIDGITTFKDGEYLVFAIQEFNSPSDGGIPTDYNNGWTNQLNIWDDNPWDYDSNTADANPGLPWDKSDYVPGYNEHLLNPATPNRRSGIWQININENDIVSLTFVKEIGLYGSMFVRNGYTYGSTNIFLDPLIKISTGKTIPSYSIISQEIRTTYTTFDGNGTRFYDHRDQYSAPEVGDKYIKFAKNGVFI